MGGLALTISGCTGLLNKKASIVSNEKTTVTTARTTINSVWNSPNQRESFVGRSGGKLFRENVGGFVRVKSNCDSNEKKNKKD